MLHVRPQFPFVAALSGAIRLPLRAGLDVAI
jgi:hypothetical protein